MTHICLANTTDIPHLLILEYKVFNKKDCFHERQFKYLIQSPSALVMTLKDKKQIVGYGILLFRKNSYMARLYSFAIDKTYQGQGAALRLLHYLEKYLVQHRYHQLRLEVRATNQRAIIFYKKNGFELFNEKKDFYADGAKALCMRKFFNS